jgi:4-phospho-D-threonate 3-dehydrogenase / 4-phospho-D-erythronate 3-dehydrogenase
MKKIAISLGDPNGVGIEIALRSHSAISKFCKPIYCIDKNTLQKAAKLLNLPIPKDFKLYGKYNTVKINPGKIKKDAGRFSYHSFLSAIHLAKQNKVDAVCTLPIHKEAWAKAEILYVGHTDMLRDIFGQDAIMMLGCEKMYVALYTEHIPLKKVTKYIKTKKLTNFLIDLYNSLQTEEPIAVLGVNPHAGDNGVLGDEDKKIDKAIKRANKFLQKDVFYGTFVPDVAFTPNMRKKYSYFVAMYHDQGLAPLKALYFDESINVSLNLPIIRTSVDHGTAFDIAYSKGITPSNISYINAIKMAVK